MGKMLVIADINTSNAAVSRGLELARRLGLAVEVVAFAWASLKGLELGAGDKAEARQRLLNAREQEVEERIAKYRKEGQKVSLKVVWNKDIVSWVLRRVEGGKYTMVVKTGNRSETLVHTPTDWQLLRECPVPVLIVARDKWVRTKPVLAALDLGTTNRDKRKLNHQVVAEAKRIAEVLGAELKLLSAVEVPTLLDELDMVDPISYVKKQKQAMQSHITELAEAHNLPRSAFQVKRGPVSRVITSEAARVRAQLVVMGTVGRRGVKARLLGNTAESVLQLLHTDVMALKP
ncbi:universal stress protein [Parahaliea mediterranea]|uniref:Universal stress protein n=1 Tax=Parahaliea mediterranea TaxID=651086 RepID=A0A939IL79_9GAMM|nr:universal stress protein [Parahaliea mediterranea]MBN7798106.1 universal stress protein [Parahaliea mediterranea]